MKQKQAFPQKLCQWVLVFLAAVALLLFPQESSAAITIGLDLCYRIIIPALFPFFVLSSLVIQLGISQTLGGYLSPLMSPLFRLNGNCATPLVLGFIGGYPVGAKTALSLYTSGQCTATEAQRMLAFCNNSGPAFILTVLGTGIFASQDIALILYAAHLLACITVGFLFRFYKPEDKASTPSCHKATATSFVSAFLSAVTGAIHASLNICGFILTFTVILHLLTHSKILPTLSLLLSHLTPLSQDYATTLLTGLLELSSGVTALPQTGSLSAQVALASFLLGWAGLSVHCQVLAFAQETNLPLTTYFVGNFAQGLFAAVFSVLLLQQFPPTATAFLPQEVIAIPTLPHHYLVSLTCGLWLLFLFLPKKG